MRGAVGRAGAGHVGAREQLRALRARLGSRRAEAELPLPLGAPPRHSAVEQSQLQPASGQGCDGTAVLGELQPPWNANGVRGRAGSASARIGCGGGEGPSARMRLHAPASAPPREPARPRPVPPREAGLRARRPAAALPKAAHVPTERSRSQPAASSASSAAQPRGASSPRMPWHGWPQGSVRRQDASRFATHSSAQQTSRSARTGLLRGVGRRSASAQRGLDRATQHQRAPEATW